MKDQDCVDSAKATHIEDWKEEEGWKTDSGQ